MKKKEKKKRRIFSIIGAVALAAFLLLMIVFFRNAPADRTKESIHSIKNAVLERALQCYVIEGSYPAELSYLKEHYGLLVNTEKYVIDYRGTGENLPLQVIVVAKRK